MSRPDFSNPLIIVATGVAAGPVLWGIAQLLIAIADFFRILITVIAAAGGIAFWVATTGFATAGSIASWIAIAATVGVAAAGASTTILVIVKIVEKGQEKPYEWLLPALTLLAVFFVDLTKDQLQATSTERAIYALNTGILTVGGGFLLMQRQVAVRAIGFALPFLPLIAVWVLLLQQKRILDALSDFITSGAIGAIGLMGAFVLALVIVALGVLLPKHNYTGI
jgi:hypothetical protein